MLEDDIRMLQFWPCSETAVGKSGFLLWAPDRPLKSTSMLNPPADQIHQPIPELYISRGAVGNENIRNLSRVILTEPLKT